MARFLLFLIFLTGCTYETTEESPDDMRVFNPLQWGQSKRILPVEWQQDKPVTILTKDADYVSDETQIQNGRPPFTKNLTLGVNYPAEPSTGDYALRWLVVFGVGGASQDFLIDASGLQQLSLSADTMRVSLVSQYQGITDLSGNPIGTVSFGYANPRVVIEAAAFYAEGMTSTDPPTLTQQFAIDPGDDVDVPVPKFASAFRILGDPSASTTPFLSTASYTLLQSDATTIEDLYTGDEIFTIRLAPIPVNNAAFLNIANGSGGPGVRIKGFIAWELDL